MYKKTLTAHGHTVCHTVQKWQIGYEISCHFCPLSLNNYVPFLIHVHLKAHCASIDFFSLSFFAGKQNHMVEDPTTHIHTKNSLGCMIENSTPIKTLSLGPVHPPLFSHIRWTTQGGGGWLWCSLYMCSIMFPPLKFFRRFKTCEKPIFSARHSISRKNAHYSLAEKKMKNMLIFFLSKPFLLQAKRLREFLSLNEVISYTVY